MKKKNIVYESVLSLHPVKIQNSNFEKPNNELNLHSKLYYLCN